MEPVVKIGKDYSFKGNIIKQSEKSIVCNVIIPDDIDIEAFNDIMVRDNLSYIVECTDAGNTEYIGYIGSIDVNVNGNNAKITLSLASLNDLIKDFYRMKYLTSVGGTERAELWSGIVNYIDNDLADIIIKQL